MRPLGWLFALCLWSAAAAGGADPVQLRGAAVQGGVIIGQAPPGSTVTLDGETLRLSADGAFVFGFGRDHGESAVLAARLPDGSRWRRELEVAAREYDIQRIDGLPPSKVSPDAEALARIREEGRQTRAARARDDARTDFVAPFIWPARGPISGVYGSQRILNGEPRRPHFGVDVAAPTGTPVRAPAAGIVTLAHPDMYFSGGTLIIDHGHRLSSSFLHLSKIHVAVGERVAQGQLIAEIGATGRVTGPHLDWRMNWRDRRVDPQTLVGPMPETD